MIEKMKQLLTPLVEKEGYELVDIEFISNTEKIIRVYIDKPSGRMSIKDCEFMTQKISDAIDAIPELDYSYILEVSSPGIYRALKNEKDFIKFIGHDIKIVTKDGSTYDGKLLNFKDKKISLSTRIGEVEINIEEIASANLQPDLSGILNKDVT